MVCAFLNIGHHISGKEFIRGEKVGNSYLACEVAGSLQPWVAGSYGIHAMDSKTGVGLGPCPHDLAT